MTSTCISLKISARSFTLSATWLICFSRSADIWSIMTSWSVCCALKRGSHAASSGSSKNDDAPPAPVGLLLSDKSGRYSSMAWPLILATYDLWPFRNSASSSWSCLAILCWMFTLTSCCAGGAPRQPRLRPGRGLWRLPGVALASDNIGPDHLVASTRLPLVAAHQLHLQLRLLEQR